MNARVQIISILVVLSSMFGCAGINRPKADWATAPGVDLAAYSTYAWADGPADQPRTVLNSQVRKALRTELENKNYRESSDAPDFRVSYEIVESERGQRSSPVRIGIGIGTWGRRVGGSVGTSVGVGGGDPDQSYRLVIRAIDPDRNQELWVGGTTTFEMPAEERVIDRAVAGVMRGFPTGAADAAD